jgi:hypothetical protein
LADTPTPDKASLIRFLLTCPSLQRLSQADLEPLAARLQMKRYEDAAELLHHQVPHRDMPLRVVVHGHASWEPSDSAEQRGAWMLTPGSVFGLGAVNDWAHEHGVQGTWPRADLVHIRCKAAGPIWVLELAPQHFDDVFLGEQAQALRAELLCMFPTTIHASKIVAALRQDPQFVRVATPKLYRLLERAPTLDYEVDENEDDNENDNDEPQPVAVGPQGKLVSGPAIYYVLDGELNVCTNGHTILVCPGELGGPDLFDATQAVAEFTAKATTKSHAVVLTQRALTQTMRGDPGLTRTLGPRLAGDVVNP